MNIQSQAAMNRARENWQVTFLKAFTEGAGRPLAEIMCQMETSKKAVEIRKMLTKFPGFKKFTGEIEAESMAWTEQSLANEEWADTVLVPRADIERDDIGQYGKEFEMMGAAARRHPDELLAAVMASAFTTNDYTGLPFFAADKPHIPGVVDAKKFTNLMTAKPSAGSLEAAYLLMAGIRDATGKPMGIGGKKMVVCSDKWGSTFRKLLKAETIVEVVTGEGVATVANIYSGTADLAVFNYLYDGTNDDKWFVLDQSWPLRAFILQHEVKPRFIAQDRETDDIPFRLKKNAYQGYYRGNVGFGLPQLAVGSTGATSAL
jgi:phage major head subunit gpT-like protein